MENTEIKIKNFTLIKRENTITEYDVYFMYNGESLHVGYYNDLLNDNVKEMEKRLIGNNIGDYTEIFNRWHVAKIIKDEKN